MAKQVKLGPKDGDDRIALFDLGIACGLQGGQFMSLFSDQSPQRGELNLAVMARRFHG
jgi:hypothetical protein